MSNTSTSKVDQPISVLVTVDDAHRDALAAIADKLSDAGLRVMDMFELGGVIAGDVAASNLSHLTSVDGVAHVEEDTPFSASM